MGRILLLEKYFLMVGPDVENRHAMGIRSPNIKNLIRGNNPNVIVSLETKVKKNIMIAVQMQISYDG